MAKIFIVEDSKIVTLHLQKTLESAGYEVIGTENSGEGLLEQLKNIVPDLILMDIMVNGEIDGIQTATKVKELYSIPIIYITALSDQSTIQRAKVTQPYGYLTKPFEDRDIFAIVEMALYKHSIETQLRLSEERFFNTLNSISDAVITIDTKFRITYLNPAAQVLTGCNEAWAIGRDFMEVLTLRETQSGIFPFNPLHCEIGKGATNILPDGLVLISRNGAVPVGSGSIAPITSAKGELSGLVIIFKDMTEIKLREQIERNLEKKQLAALIEGQERERCRISRELHDGLGQMLNAIKMKFDVNNDVKNLIDGALLEISRISENLMPYKLKDFQLVECLQSLCEQFDNSEKVKVSFSCYGDSFVVGEQQKINLYRIAQEGLTNALKYARATDISIQLNKELDKIQLLIEDNGIGFQQASVKETGSHHGLSNMQERAESMGGSLFIESDAQRGTLLIVETPI